MIRQSTNHLFMVEPADFYDNPQTKPTNAYQVREQAQNRAEIQSAALKEFRAYRDMLVEHGVQVTTVKGQAGCPDDIFPNWMSTHPTGQMVVYPMKYENRQKERLADVIADLRPRYKDYIDLTAFERKGLSLESTSSVNLDHVNRVAYMARSPRSDDAAAKEWARVMGFTLIPFDTEHNGMQVYHSDVVLWIGTTLAGIASECIKTKGIVDALKKHRTVVEFDNVQMGRFAGNALEVVGRGGERMLAMSENGWTSLDARQQDMIRDHYKTIITPSLPTIEKYGGGSARCMLLELF